LPSGQRDVGGGGGCDYRRYFFWEKVGVEEDVIQLERRKRNQEWGAEKEELKIWNRARGHRPGGITNP